MKKVFLLVICTMFAIFTFAQLQETEENLSEKSQTDIVVYPNPTPGIVYLEHLKPVSEVRITNLFGQLVGKFKTSHNQNYILDVSELSHGMYFIHVTDEDNNIYVEKIIKE